MLQLTLITPAPFAGAATPGPAQQRVARLLECPGPSPVDEAASAEDPDPEALLHLPCPASPAPPIACELLCAVELPPGGLQLLLDMPAEGAGADPASLPVGEPVSSDLVAGWPAAVA